MQKCRLHLLLEAVSTLTTSKGLRISRTSDSVATTKNLLFPLSPKTCLPRLSLQIVT